MPEPVRSLRLRVASPCTEDWEAMSGNHLVRFCGKCEKNVYNLSELTTAEASRLVEEMEGRMCATFFARTDGTVLTTDCPVGERKARRKRQVLAAVFGAIAGLFGWLARPVPATSDLAPPEPVRPMSKIAPGPTAPPVEIGTREMGEPAPVRETGAVAPKVMGKIAAPIRKLGGPARLTGDVAIAD